MDEANHSSSRLSKKAIALSLVLGAIFTTTVLMVFIAMAGDTAVKIAAKSEVTAVFAEFRLRQEQYKLEHQKYLSSNASNSETDTWPISTPSGGAKSDLLPLPATWTMLGMNPDADAVHCSYVTLAGDARDNANIGPIANLTFALSAPDTDWYYLLAHCDMDGDPTFDSYYLQWSGSSDLYVVNPGR